MSGGFPSTANFLYPDKPEKACFFADGGEPPRVVIEDPEITRPKAGIIKKLLLIYPIIKRWTSVNQHNYTQINSSLG
jgi:hypothetical protein